MSIGHREENVSLESHVRWAIEPIENISKRPDFVHCSMWHGIIMETIPYFLFVIVTTTIYSSLAGAITSATSRSWVASFRHYLDNIRNKQKDDFENAFCIAGQDLISIP